MPYFSNCVPLAFIKRSLGFLIGEYQSPFYPLYYYIYISSFRVKEREEDIYRSSIERIYLMVDIN